MPSALVLFAEGSEEIETVAVVDILRRAGISVDLCAVGNNPLVKCSRDVIIKSDCVLSSYCHCDESQHDLIYLPGGLVGTMTLSANDKIGLLLKKAIANDKWICAMCAAPMVLMNHGNLLHDHQITSHPSVKSQLIEGGYEKYSSDRVVVDRKLITSQGPGTSIEMALKLVELIVGKEKATEISDAIVF